jgi:electron-transferring-flavoprotein dehydrogenase
LKELLPEWQLMDPPIRTPVTDNQVKFLTKKMAIPLPILHAMGNNGNYIASLNEVCRWLGAHAESLGVEIYPAIAGSKVRYLIFIIFLLFI